MNTQKQSPSGTLPITEAFEQFITWLRFRSVRPATIAAHSQKLNQFFKEMEVDYLEQITAVLVGHWLEKMRSQHVMYADHPYREPVAKKLSPVTLRERLKTVRYFVRVCVKQGLLAIDPLAGLPSPKFEKVRVRERTMRQETVTSLLDVATHPRDLALIAFMADTGVRVGEVPGLLISQLNLEKRTAVIDGKTKVRQVTFSSQCAALLHCWLQNHTVPKQKQRHLFVSIGNRSLGRPLTEGAIRTLFRKLGRAAGAAGPVNPHAMRHLVGQLWTDLANPRLAQEKLGHADLRTTLSFYYHPDFEEVAEKTEKLTLLA